MTAFSLGRSLDEEQTRLTDAVTPGPVSKALGIITELIPGEAIAAYLALISAIAVVQPTADGDPRAQLGIFVAIPIAIVVTFAFAIVGAARAIRKAEGAARGWQIARALGFGLGTSLLFILYVVAMPENPIEAVYHVPSTIGGLIAVGFTILWGAVRAVMAAFRTK